MLDKIDALYEKFKVDIGTVSKQADVLNLKSEVIGKKGKD